MTTAHDWFRRQGLTRPARHPLLRRCLRRRRPSPRYRAVAGPAAVRAAGPGPARQPDRLVRDPLDPHARRRDRARGLLVARAAGLPDAVTRVAAGAPPRRLIEEELDPRVRLFLHHGKDGRPGAG